MQAGTKERFTCESCSVEFDLTYEPKATKDKKAAEKITDNDIAYCPFCGDDIDEEDTKDDEEDDSQE